MVLSDSPVIRASALHIEDGTVRWSEPRDGPAAELVDLRGKTLDHLEDVAIRAAWERHAGRRGAIARELGIARSSLLRKLDALGLRNGAPAAG